MPRAPELSCQFAARTDDGVILGVPEIVSLCPLTDRSHYDGRPSAGFAPHLTPCRLS